MDKGAFKTGKENLRSLYMTNCYHMPDLNFELVHAYEMTDTDSEFDLLSPTARTALRETERQEFENPLMGA